MKRLLLGPALIAPLALFGCSWGVKTPELPKVPEIVRQIPLEDFEHFPPIVTTPPAAAPVAPVRKPKVKKHAPARPAARPVPSVVPVPQSAPREPELAPQQGPICIFPLNMIPNCTPQRT